MAAAISLDYALGFNGYFRLNSWTPLTVVLENRGRTIHGTLEVIVTSGSEFLRTVHQTVHTMQVDLPYNSTKLASFSIHLSSFTHDLAIQLRDDSDEILAETALSLRTAYTEKPMIVVLDDRITPDFLSVLPPDAFAVNAYPRFLPETAVGYEGVAMLIVNAEVLKSLREQQFQALQAWVSQGGFMVTGAPMNYGVLQESRWQRLMPMRILGHQEFLDLPALARFCGEGLTSTTPFLVLHTRHQQARILLEEDGTPLLLEQSFGNGKLVFVTLDLQHPPFSRWSGREAFWENILALRPPGLQTTLAIDKQTVLGALIKNMPAGFPDKRIAFGMLAIYILLFKLITVSFGQRGTPSGRVLGLTALLIALFSGMSYGVFLYPNQKQRLAYNSVLHAHASGNDEVILAEGIVGVYSLKDTAYDLGFGDGFYPVQSLVARNLANQTPIPYTLHHTDHGVRIEGALDKWSYNFFTFAIPVEFQMKAEARYESQEGLHITIDNPTPQPLRTVYGYFAGKLFSLGTVAAEAHSTKLFRQTTIQEQALFESASLRSVIEPVQESEWQPFWQGMHQDLTKYLLTAIHESYNGREDVFVLVGWMPSSGITLDFAASGQIGDAVTLVTWVIPVE